MFKKLAIITGIPAVTVTAAKINLMLHDQKLNSSLPKSKIDVNLNQKEKKAVIIGAGVAGVTSAYQLAKRGFNVTVLDFSDSPAAQCSAVPAGGMQKTNPVVNRKSWIGVIKSWNPFAKDEFPFFQIKWTKTLNDPHFLRWMTLFSYYSIIEPSSQYEAQHNHFEFTLFALDEIQSFIKEKNLTDITGLNPGGALNVKYDENAPLLPKGKTTKEPTEKISGSNAVSLEPSLRNWKKQVLWAAFETNSCAGNSENFTKEVAKIAESELNVKFLLNTEVKMVEVDKEKKCVRSLKTNKGEIDIDENTEVVIAAGSWTPRILWTCGYFAPIYPMKGYSVAIDLPPKGSNERPDEMDIPGRMLIDSHSYISRLGDQVRVTSIGEFCGWETMPDPKIDELFRNDSRPRIPGLEKFFDSTPTRCGLRPYSANGIIILGRVDGVSNLSVNAGPGFNGWKISYGAADVLARILTDESKSDYKFNCEHFSPRNTVKYSPIWSMLSRSRWC